MITSIELTGVRYTLDEPIKRYVQKRIGQLDRYLPRHARKSLRAEVKLRQIDGEHGNKYEAEVLLHTPDHKIVAKDSTLNMFAALDIVRAKLYNQMMRYKSDHNGHVGNRKALSKFKRSYARES